MALEVPNTGTASFPNQARLDSGDIAVIAQGLAGDGVISGCAVTAQGSPNMTVAVAAGNARLNSTSVAVTAGNVTVTSNSSGLTRVDLIVVNSSGTKSALAGTPGAAPLWAPASGYVVLARIEVPSGVSAITSSHITDKRAFVQPTPVKLSAAVPNDSTRAAANTTTINAEQVALDAAGGGLLILPAGSIWHTGITGGRLSSLVGQGIGATSLVLANGSNVASYTSYNYAALIVSLATASNLVPHGFVLRDLTFDGNKANQTAGNGLNIYGMGFVLDNVAVHNAYADGISTSFGSGDTSPMPGGTLEADFARVWVYGAGGRGIFYGGPHDAHFGTIVTAYCGGVGVEVQNTCEVEFLHAWGCGVGFKSDTNTPVRINNLQVENCKSEGAIFAGSEIAMVSKLRAFNNWTVGTAGAHIKCDTTTVISSANINVDTGGTGILLNGDNCNVTNFFVSAGAGGTGTGIDIQAQRAKIVGGQVYGFNATGGIGIHVGDYPAASCLSITGTNTIDCATHFSVVNAGDRNFYEMTMHCQTAGQVPWSLPAVGWSNYYRFIAGGAVSASYAAEPADLFWGQDNTHDIGSSGNYRPRDLFLGRNLVVGGTATVGGVVVGPPSRATFSNANATATAANRILAQTGTLSAARVVTLPAANAVPGGTVLQIVDESGTATGTFTLSWARAGSDTINGGTANVVAVNAAYGNGKVMSDGASKWTTV